MATLTMDRTGDRRTTLEDLKGLRAEGYVRDSTLDQRDGFGPDIQRRNIQRFSESYGLVLGERWYTEFVSGRSVKKRREFQQFLEDARLDRFDVLLVDHTSRFGRNQAECIRHKEELQSLGKTVVFVSQGIISGTDRDFLAERINETLDEAYSRNLSRYVRTGFAEKAAKGHSIGPPPLGYRTLRNPSGRGAWAVPDPKTMLALLALVKGYASGEHSFKSLAQELNAQGYRTSEGKTFTESSISTVLNNPFYMGKFVYHRSRVDEEVRDGVHEVPQEIKTLWLKCQKVRREKASPGNPSPASREYRVYPLTGVLVCDGCGQPYHGITSRSPSGLFRRMDHSWHRCEMRPRSVGAPKVEQEFAEKVLSCIQLDDGWQQAVLRAMSNEGPVPDHTLESKRIEMAIANLRKQHLWGVINDEGFKEEFQALERQRKVLALPSQPQMIPELEKAARLLQDLPALWQHPGVSPEQQRDLAREVFQELRLRQGNLVAVLPCPEYAPLFAYSIWQYNVAGGDRSP